MKPSLAVISFMDHVFGVLSKNSLSGRRSPRFSPMLSSRSFMSLSFTFRLMIDFELIFMVDNNASRFIFLHVYI